jgi:hypothetical protein
MRGGMGPLESECLQKEDYSLQMGAKRVFQRQVADAGKMR